MNQFLKTRDELNACTNYINENGLIPHGLSCKDFDIRHIVPLIEDGNILDMGASGSWVLENAVKKGVSGLKVGIDLAYEKEHETKDGIDLVKGDLMNTNYPDKFFKTVCCLSVVEHEVSIPLLAKEASRLLQTGGSLFLTFDYWENKISTDGLMLYGLKWNILDKKEVEEMIEIFNENGLELTSEVDWTTQDAVINDKYCSPFSGISYTFGLLQFIKK